MHRITLLLNVAVLVATFCVALGTTETQVRVLRTTARTAFDLPWGPRRTLSKAEDRPPVSPGGASELGPVPVARLVKYLARLDAATLTRNQVDAVYQALEECASELARGARKLRAAGDDGARARVLIDRVERRVASTLKAADVPEGELLTRLVRVVMASAG